MKNLHDIKPRTKFPSYGEFTKQVNFSISNEIIREIFNQVREMKILLEAYKASSDNTVKIWASIPNKGPIE